VEQVSATVSETALMIEVVLLALDLLKSALVFTDDVVVFRIVKA